MLMKADLFDQKWDVKAEFSASLLQSPVSHDPSATINGDLLLNVFFLLVSCAASYFCGNVKFKEQYLLKYK